jgi:hypothetical protein
MPFSQLIGPSEKLCSLADVLLPTFIYLVAFVVITCCSWDPDFKQSIWAFLLVLCLAAYTSWLITRSFRKQDELLQTITSEVSAVLKDISKETSEAISKAIAEVGANMSADAPIVLSNDMDIDLPIVITDSESEAGIGMAGEPIVLDSDDEAPHVSILFFLI